MAAETRPAPSDERVLFIPEANAFGGAERSCLALVSWLYERGIPHRVLTYADRIPLSAHVPFPLEETDLAPRAGGTVRIAALKAYFRDHRFRYPMLTSGIQAAMHAGAAGIRGYHTLMHDTPTFLPKPERRTLRTVVYEAAFHRNLRRGLNTGGTTIVTSEFLKAESEAYWRPPVEIARMGGLPSASGFAPRRSQGELRMLSVSRIEANKRIDWMIRAVGAMESGPNPLSARTDWRLDVVGKGPLIDELRTLAEREGVVDRVVFHGFLSDDAVEALYAQAHVFLMPAVQGYGIPAIEALARGLPVLLHRESGVSDILLDTPWSVVVHGDESGMRPGLERIVDTVLEARHLAAAPPEIPTEAEWAERVARLCGWLD